MSALTHQMDAVPGLVLRAPVPHPLMSGRYLVLEFTGQESGRRFRTPVAIVRRGLDEGRRVFWTSGR